MADINVEGNGGTTNDLRWTRRKNRDTDWANVNVNGAQPVANNPINVQTEPEPEEEQPQNNGEMTQQDVQSLNEFFAPKEEELKPIEVEAPKPREEVTAEVVEQKPPEVTPVIVNQESAPPSTEVTEVTEVTSEPEPVITVQQDNSRANDQFRKEVTKETEDETEMYGTEKGKRKVLGKYPAGTMEYLQANDLPVEWLNTPAGKEYLASVNAPASELEAGVNSFADAVANQGNPINTPKSANDFLGAVGNGMYNAVDTLMNPSVGFSQPSPIRTTESSQGGTTDNRYHTPTQRGNPDSVPTPEYLAYLGANPFYNMSSYDETANRMEHQNYLSELATADNAEGKRILDNMTTSGNSNNSEDVTVHNPTTGNPNGYVDTSILRSNEGSPVAEYDSFGNMLADIRTGEPTVTSEEYYGEPVASGNDNYEWGEDIYSGNFRDPYFDAGHDNEYYQQLDSLIDQKIADAGYSSFDQMPRDEYQNLYNEAVKELSGQGVDRQTQEELAEEIRDHNAEVLADNPLETQQNTPATNEENSTGKNNYTDVGTSEYGSEYNDLIAQYQREGYTRKDAIQMAIADIKAEYGNPINRHPELINENTIYDNPFVSNGMLGMESFNLADPTTRSLTESEQKNLEGAYGSFVNSGANGEDFSRETLWKLYNDPNYYPDPGVLANMDAPQIDANGKPNYTYELLENKLDYFTPDGEPLYLGADGKLYKSSGTVYVGKYDEKPHYDADTVMQTFVDMKGSSDNNGGVAWKQPIVDLLNDPSLTQEQRDGLNELLVTLWWGASKGQVFNGTEKQYNDLAQLFVDKLGLQNFIDSGLLTVQDVKSFFFKDYRGGNPGNGGSGSGSGRAGRGYGYGGGGGGGGGGGKGSGQSVNPVRDNSQNYQRNPVNPTIATQRPQVSQMTANQRQQRIYNIMKNWSF